MLLLSYLSHWAPNIANKVDEARLREVESRLNKDFFNLNQTEVAVVYSALNTLSQHGPEQLRQKIQETYGFRLWIFLDAKGSVGKALHNIYHKNIKGINDK